MCGSSQTTTTTPGQSSQNAGIWNAATGTPAMTPQQFQAGAAAAFQQGGPAAVANYIQTNQGAVNATPVTGPALPTSAPVYGQPTVAGTTADQQASYDAVRAAQGAAQPGLLASSNMASAAGAYQPSQIADPTLGPAAQTGLLTPAVAGQASGVNVAAPTVTAQDVSTSTLPQTDLSGYLNPYTQDVTNASLAAIEQARQAAQSQTSGQAIAQGAFGGSRSGVMAALTNKDYGTLAASTASSLNQANFTNAQQQAQTDLARQLQAAQSNQSANLQAGIATGNNAVQAGGINAQTGVANAGLLTQTALANNQLAGTIGMSNTAATNQQDQYGAGLLAQIQGANQNAGLTANGQSISAAGLLSGNATAGQNALLQGATALNQAGTQQQGTNQAQLSSAYQQWQNQQNYPFQYYNFLKGLSTADPTTSTTTTQQSPLATVAGLATTAAGLAGGGGIFGGGPVGSGLTPAMTAATAMTPNVTANGAMPVANIWGN